MKAKPEDVNVDLEVGFRITWILTDYIYIYMPKNDGL